MKQNIDFRKIKIGHLKQRVWGKEEKILGSPYKARLPVKSSRKPRGFNSQGQKVAGDDIPVAKLPMLLLDTCSRYLELQDTE